MNKTPYQGLLESEIIKRKKTQDELKGVYQLFTSIYNVLILLPFYKGELCSNDDEEKVLIQDAFQFFIHDTGFKVRNIMLLMEIGGYVDASILLRSLLETFVIYKYFIMNNDGSGLKEYFEINPTKRKKIKDIFEVVIPGFYDKYYASLCLNTHGNPFSQAVYRSNVVDGSPSSNINNINIKTFSIIYNQLLPLIIGVINLYKYVYPKNILDNEKITKDELPKIYNYILSDIEYREKNYPMQKEMIDYYNKIIEI